MVGGRRVRHLLACHDVLYERGLGSDGLCSRGEGIGYAMAPRILQVFLIIIVLPFPLGRIIQFLTFGWMFAAMAVSTHIALGRPSYTRVTIIIALAMLPVIILEPFLLGGQG